MTTSSHSHARRSSPKVSIHIPEGARATIEERLRQREAQPEEILHHLLGAESDSTLVGLVFTLHAQIGALSALIELGEDDWKIGRVLQLVERLSEILTNEIGRTDLATPATGETP